MALPFRVIRRFAIKAGVIITILAAFYIITRVYLALENTSLSEESSSGLARPVWTDSLPTLVENAATAPKKELELTESLKVSEDEAKVTVEKGAPKIVTKGFSARTTQNLGLLETQVTERKPCTSVHIFYYPWYNNMKIDQHYAHWNHNMLPHWDKNIDKIYEKKTHNPPDDIGSNFYPELGAYSSRDPEVIREHLSQIASAGIGVIVVSYYPAGSADENGKPWDDVYLMLLDQAVVLDVKVTFHIEPYKGRNEKTVREDIVHIINMFGDHAGFYKYEYKKNTFIPLIYVYDSYHTKPEDWARLLTPEGQDTIRGTKYDVIMIALAVELAHSRYITVGGFNGLYTYFATNGFTYGSTWQNWDQISKMSQDMKSLFIPSVGPGYIDTSIRPWNGENTRERANGKYYKNSWNSALNTSPEIISITSFNEWHEGTQIEKAIPKVTSSRTYLNYEPFKPNYYLKLTRQFVDKFAKCLTGKI